MSRIPRAYIKHLSVAAAVLIFSMALLVYFFWGQFFNPYGNTIRFPFEESMFFDGWHPKEYEFGQIFQGDGTHKRLFYVRLTADANPQTLETNLVKLTSNLNWTKVKYLILVFDGPQFTDQHLLFFDGMRQVKEIYFAADSKVSDIAIMKFCAKNPGVKVAPPRQTWKRMLALGYKYPYEVAQEYVLRPTYR